MQPNICLNLKSQESYTGGKSQYPMVRHNPVSFKKIYTTVLESSQRCNKIMSGTVITAVMLNIFMNYTLPQFLSCLPSAFQLQECIFTNRVENSVDPDQMASSEAS